MDSRSGESQLSTDDDDLGLQSMAYITTAQAKLDEGDVDGCLKIILQGTTVGAEPAILLSRAHQNVLNGQKKLMALPSAKKSIQPTPASTERKMSNSSFESSKWLQQIKRKKKLNWAPPLRPVKSTPSRTEVLKINIKKLELSPIPSSVLLYSPSPMKPIIPVSQSRPVDYDNGSFQACSSSSHYSEVMGTNKDICLSQKDATLTSKSPSVDVSCSSMTTDGTSRCEVEKQCFGEASIAPKKQRSEACLTDTMLAVKQDGTSDMCPPNCASAKLQGNTEALLQNTVAKGTDSASNLGDLKKTCQKVSEAASIRKESKEATEGLTTRSPDSLFGIDFCSENTSDRFSYHTDTNFFSEKFRCNSDSGFQEVPLKNTTTPHTMPVAKRIESDNYSLPGFSIDAKKGCFNEATAEIHNTTPIRSNISGVVDLGWKASSNDGQPKGSQVINRKTASSQSHDSFKKPVAPAVRLCHVDREVDASATLQNHVIPTQSSTGVSKQKQGTNAKPSDLSEYLMKMKNAAAEASSTTKKHKVIRIKKERYKVISVLGRGGSGKVYEVENDDGRAFAMKCVRLDDLDDVVFQSHINEIEILRTLRNEPCIIQLHEYELKNETLFMLMEKGEMDLEKYLRLNNKLEDGRIRTLWVQMLSAVASIHKQGIIHTDLKPPNFLFVDSALKLIDFGIAKGLQDNCTSTQRDFMIGTLNYMAPESVSESEYDRKDTNCSKKNYKIRRATDIWSLGCILYLIVYGKTPFQHIQNRALKVVEITEGRDIIFPDIPNKDLLDTMKGCLKRNPALRYTIEQLLSHAFVTGKGSFFNDEKENDVTLENTGHMKAFMEHVKESSVNSPKSLQRIQTSFARRALADSNSVNPARKVVF
ncbi:3-phosphoinositide-dependent protein kinase B-like [Rhopilema esculentum]|uniref:3-phosphoinositide-dependent protein kinase B-like n=1 Tax=Rhopilema esculentum TaxID=499914 RepID=UPI0031D3D2FD